MRVATKLSGAMGLLTVLMVTLLLYHVRTIRDLVSISRELSEVSSQLALHSSRQLGRLSQLEENASKYWVTRDHGYLEKFGQVLDGYAQAQDELASLPLGADERMALAQLTREWHTSRPLLEEFVANGGLPSLGGEGETLLALRERLVRLRGQTRGIGEASQEVIASGLQRSASRAREAEQVSLLAAAGALLLSVLVSVLIVRSITQSLRRLRAGTEAVAGGNFDHRLPVAYDDEFGKLARDFNVMTERLGQLEQMKRDFLSKVSHDLKTPLASMQETTRILLDEVPGALTQRQRRLLQLSDQSGSRLSSMIANILDLSGMEAGAFALAVRRCELAPLVQLARDQLEPMLLERRVQVSLALPAEPVRLDCDPERLVQVLVNLLENAVKFSPVGAEVRVEARLGARIPLGEPHERWRMGLRNRDDHSNTLLISIADAGPGVPEADRERIFERFVQTEVGRRARGRGVGLGLPICREIVSAHGGTVWVEDNPTGGTIFRVLLPWQMPKTPEAESTCAAVASR